MVENWKNNLPTEIHSIAGPIGSAFSRNACTFNPPERIPNKLTFYQWKTQHHLDVAFKRLKNDPQDLNLLGSKTTRLPESYRGRRLGHNWSISWVADKLGPLNKKHVFKKKSYGLNQRGVRRLFPESRRKGI